MSRLTLLVALIATLAIALPDSTEAASLNEIKKLTASDAAANDQFGAAVAINGDSAVVGALLEDAGGEDAGAAYIFQRNQGGVDDWGEVKKLVASDAEGGDFFGASVAVSGDTAVVVAPQEDCAGSNAGAAYVFQRDQGNANNWSEVTKLLASDAQASDSFGSNVTVSGDTIVVGARGEDTEGSNAGAAYVFLRDEGGTDDWGEVKKLTASDAQSGDEFGVSASISGDTLVVGAYLNQLDGFPEAGAAYVFQRDMGGANNWGEVKRLTASDAQGDDEFGTSVAISGDAVVVGAMREDTGGSEAGAAYMFERNQGGTDNWGEASKFIASDAQQATLFGWSVAVSGATALVGANRDDAGGESAGAAYVFDLQQSQPVGGIALDSDLRSLPLEQTDPGRAHRGLAALAAAASVVAVGSVAWYARRRRGSS